MGPQEKQIILALLDDLFQVAKFGNLELVKPKRDFYTALFNHYRPTRERHRLSILLRKFERLSTYEPDPKREEWQGFDDCDQCPHQYCWSQYGFLWCRITPKTKELGDPSFCRFTEYRSILFRSFRSML